MREGGHDVAPAATNTVETNQSQAEGEPCFSFINQSDLGNEQSATTSTIQQDLDSIIPDRDYAEFVIRTAKKTVKQEDLLVRQIFYVGLSKDSSNPLNLAVLAPTSEGKTHAVLETLQYFPKNEIWKVGSMSPKVIIRQNGSAGR